MSSPGGRAEAGRKTVGSREKQRLGGERREAGAKSRPGNGDAVRNDTDAANGGPAVGRLAQVIATRSGKAAPETEFVIEHREALIYALCQAAELEHGIMCQYLFAAFSLKQSTAEGLTPEQLEAVTRWRKIVGEVARQEMLHLALVQNLLTALGAAPHLGRPNLPTPTPYFPPGVSLALVPFGEQALRHFLFLERPEGMPLQDAEGYAAVASHARSAHVTDDEAIVPHAEDFATVGHLYRAIDIGFAWLTSRGGEQCLFVGPASVQA